MTCKVEAGNLLEIPEISKDVTKLGKLEQKFPVGTEVVEIPVESPALILACAVSFDGVTYFTPPMGVKPGQLFYIKVTVAYDTVHVWKAWAHLWLTSPSGVSFDMGEQESREHNYILDSMPHTAELIWQGTIEEGQEYGMWDVTVSAYTRRRFWVWFGGEEAEITTSILKLLEPGEEPPYVPPAPPAPEGINWLTTGLVIGGGLLLIGGGIYLVKKI